jgi:hypothetical protein
MSERSMLALLAVMTFAGPAGAQEVKHESSQAQPSRPIESSNRGGAQSQFAPPPQQPPDDQAKQARGRMSPPHVGSKPEAGRLAGAILISAENGQAQLRLGDGTTLTLQVGASIDGDVVKSVRGRRVVLQRPARAGQPGGDALVVVDFPEGGAARTLVLWSAYPGIAPERPTGGQ